jgi:formate dehydrogenase beta subunit
VVVGSDMQTGCEGVFAGGDMVPFDRTVTTAIGHGKKAARSIDAWLRGTNHHAQPKHDGATFEMLRLWYHAEARRRGQSTIDIERRCATFEEVIGGLDRESAGYEAQRCLSCGNCFECDGCYSACPEQAVIKLGPGRRYRYDFDRCTGCAICYDQCPCGAIAMVAEMGAQG